MLLDSPVSIDLYVTDTGVIEVVVAPTLLEEFV
jgi:hypothetical protein